MSTEPEVKKALVTVYEHEDADDFDDEVDYARQPSTIDTIEFEGHLWLVPQWRDGGDGNARAPVRIVRPLRQKLEPSAGAGENYYLERPIPNSVLAGKIHARFKAEFVVIESPSLTVRGARKR